MTANASAQSLPPINLLHCNSRRNISRRKNKNSSKLDDAYKAVTKKIPDQKAHDPWAGARETSTVPDPKRSRNELTPWLRSEHRQAAGAIAQAVAPQ
jgi:hypothetical protein